MSAAMATREDRPRSGRPASVDPKHARITTPAPVELFRDYRDMDPTPVVWLRAARAAMVWRARPGWRAATIYLRLVGWIVRFPPDVVRFLYRHGRTWKETFGRSYLQQAGDMCVIAFTNALMPRDYYRCDIARKRNTDAFFHFVPYGLTATPVTVISAASSDGNLATIGNKWALGKKLAESGIPVPATYALVHGTSSVAPDGSKPVLPETDLLVKPAAELQGHGVSVWRFDNAAKRWSNGQQSLDVQEFFAELGRRSEKMTGGAIVQEVLRNHSDILPFAPYALSTFRVETMIDETGDPTVVICQFRTAVDPASVVDNFHAGGYMFLVDTERGCFAEGHHGRYSSEPVLMHEHPVTKAPITGETVPGLDDVLALAIEAHRLFPELPCIGWDIALSDKGPVVIEANVPPGLQPTQQVSMGGFVQTRCMELLGYHAKRWIEENEPPQSRFRVGAKRTAPGRK